jgi:prefoldin subunit 5
MTTEPSRSIPAAEFDALKSELKALKELVAKLQSRMEQIEDEMTALRNMI